MLVSIQLSCPVPSKEGAVRRLRPSWAKKALGLVDQAVRFKLLAVVRRRESSVHLGQFVRIWASRRVEAPLFCQAKKVPCLLATSPSPSPKPASPLLPLPNRFVLVVCLCRRHDGSRHCYVLR